MSSNVNWANPYALRDGRWYKGNLHTHTCPASGCGRVSIEDCVDLYVKHGYDFIAISDHKVYTQHSDKRITILPGIEWNAPMGFHAGVYSLSTDDIGAALEISDLDMLLAKLSASEALVILNHPNWQLRPHYRREELEQRRDYDGIEIYNGVIERLDGYAISTDKWDYLLAKGLKVLGFANDDSHIIEDIGLASIHVRSRTNSPQDIMSAIKSGNFYCSSGALIDDIRMENGIIEIDTPDAQEIQVHTDGGLLIHRTWDRSISFNTSDLQRAYVRFTVYGKGSAMAWTQPFFLS